jgi:hypothetical protein
VTGELEIRVSDAERDDAAVLLRDHCVAGRLTLDEYAQRLDEVYASRTRAELERSTRELPAPAAASRRRALRLVLSIFGHAVRRGRLRLRRWTLALSIFGDVDLDLRQATIEQERAAVVVVSIFGNADLYLPEGIDVDAGGIVLFGHARDWGRDEPRPGAPHVRVRALTLFGSVDVWRVPHGASGTYGEVIKQVRRGQRELPL